MPQLSILIPARNEETHLRTLVERIDTASKLHNYTYQAIFVDDHSTDHSVAVLRELMHHYPIEFYSNTGKRGKAASLLLAAKHAKYDIIATIDCGGKYCPEDLANLIDELQKGTSDIVIAKRKHINQPGMHKMMSSVFRRMHKLPYDVQSGLKVFRREVIERLAPHMKPSPWSFDLEFISLAQQAGYRISEVETEYTHKKHSIGKLLSYGKDMGMGSLKLKFREPEAIPFHPAQAKNEGLGFHYKGQKFIHHTALQTHETAFKRVNFHQRVYLSLLWTFLVVIFLLNWHLALLFIMAFLTIIYFADLGFNFFLIYRSFSLAREVTIRPDELQAYSSYDWPVYTIFCPLYKEAHVIPQFIRAMNDIEYPKDKLQVMLLLEEDDAETLEYLKHNTLPPSFEAVVVPQSLPKTKPKACNYGLTKARGEYCVIYDAEDVPDPLQLKKAIIAFKKLHDHVFCIQAKLNFYNPHQNVLTRVFTAEYSLWFDLVLTGLQSIKAPIPLGGTSNHFKVKSLQGIKGWDAFNVTEDCDLGIRLVKNGYTTAIIDSLTLEEANSSAMNWFWQRTRWIKGYMQTYLVHSRSIRSFLKAKNKFSFVTFQLVVGGKILSMFINPVMWVTTISYFLFRAEIGSFIDSFFPAPIFYMAVFSLVIGNFLYMYYYMIGCVKRGQDDLVKYTFLVPFYWLAMSAAAWVAFYNLLRRPHHWFKTKHGLHLSNVKSMKEVHRMTPSTPALAKVREM